METGIHSASQSGVEKPPGTPDMSVHDTEAMVDSLLWDSPLPDPEKTNEEILEDGGSGKLPGEGEGKKIPEGGGKDQTEETPAGKHVPPCKKGIFLLLSI